MICKYLYSQAVAHAPETVQPKVEISFDRDTYFDNDGMLNVDRALHLACHAPRLQVCHAHLFNLE
jgi:hypothetical protein